MTAGGRQGAWVLGSLLGSVVGSVVASAGCGGRAIHDSAIGADGEGGLVATETDTLGDSSGVSTGPVEPGRQCTIAADCGDDQTCYQGVCVGTGSVRVSLAWNVVTDLDLHVRVPNGEWISYQLPLTDYGQLDVDDCVAGACVDQHGTHVENIVLEAHAPRGTYGVMVVNFDGRQQTDYAIEVAGETSATFVGHLDATTSAEGPLHEFSW